MNKIADSANILGSKWTIEVKKQDEDEILQSVEGYADRTTRRIVICDASGDTDYRDYDAFQRKVLRHEIIHAFMFESGLGECADYGRNGTDHPELMVDWFATQFKKLEKAFIDSGAHTSAFQVMKED